MYVNIELGYGTTFTFQEDAGLGPLSTQRAIEAYEGWHCALYIFDYEGTYNRIVQAGINQVDHPYKLTLLNMLDNGINSGFQTLWLSMKLLQMQRCNLEEASCCIGLVMKYAA